MPAKKDPKAGHICLQAFEEEATGHKRKFASFIY